KTEHGFKVGTKAGVVAGFLNRNQIEKIYGINTMEVTDVPDRRDVSIRQSVQILSFSGVYLSTFSQTVMIPGNKVDFVRNCTLSTQIGNVMCKVDFVRYSIYTEIEHIHIKMEVEKVQKFMWVVVNLQSFPLFSIYLVMILLGSVWQRVTSPLQIRPVSIITIFNQSESTFVKEPADYLKPYFKMYYTTKIIELLDTVFMIIRHRSRQISFLHVYHHSTMLLLSDSAYNMYPWPGIAPYLALNSFVHVVLYLYYGLTALFPDKSFPWKKHLTQLQIIQFLILFCHAAVGYLYHGYCVYGLFYGITMTSLFSNFYYQAYMRPRKSNKSHSS
ncbi:hypothetical protein KUTeg_006548, partial [Tegillarca granosa]